MCTVGASRKHIIHQVIPVRFYHYVHRLYLNRQIIACTKYKLHLVKVLIVGEDLVMLQVSPLAHISKLKRTRQ